MPNSLNLMSIYGIPPAPYSDENPDDLFLSGLPSLEQIASFNLAMQSQKNQTPSMQSNMNTQGFMPATNISGDMSTPATTIGTMPTDITSIFQPQNTPMGSASSEIPPAFGTMMSGSSGSDLTQQITDFSNPYPVTAESIQYLNGFIRTQIGRRAQIQFLMGNSDLVTKDGFLLGVGANYILINEIGTNDITACDFYNIKFIRFLY